MDVVVEVRSQFLGCALLNLVRGSVLAIILLVACSAIAQADSVVPAGNAVESANATGVARTITTDSSFDGQNPFFKSLGTNGRSCATCHSLSEGLTLSPESIQATFDASQGLDPLFAAVDGANSPTRDMSTVEARRANTTLMRTKGLFRVGLPVPADAEFILESVDDPYGFASAKEISCYRRPLPTTNLRFLSSVMWDGRELKAGSTVTAALQQQVRDAVMGHMETTVPPTEVDVTKIVEFETHLYTTQISDDVAGILPSAVAPESLVFQRFFSGINAFLPGAARGNQFNPTVFTFFPQWLRNRIGRKPPTAQQIAQQSIARGERIFNTRPFLITNVAGLTDTIERSKALRRRFNVARPGGPIRGTCSSCHSIPGVGGGSLPLVMNTGVSDAALRTPDMPLYTFRHKVSGARVQTTDPGAGIITGKWRDIGAFKVPSLRGIETRSPYMHNGFTDDLGEVVNFYDRRFGIGLTPQEKSDLAAFLRVL